MVEKVEMVEIVDMVLAVEMDLMDEWLNYLKSLK